jgi:hypothetical protein
MQQELSVSPDTAGEDGGHLDEALFGGQFRVGRFHHRGRLRVEVNCRLCMPWK